jgi:hypothetical protein
MFAVNNENTIVRILKKIKYIKNGSIQNEPTVSRHTHRRHGISTE